MFRIRVDIVNDLNSDQLIEVCDSVAHVVIRHELPHGNPHYHMWLKTDTKENTLRQRFKRKFGFLKSSDYSIKKCDEERSNEYVQYMFNTKHGNKWELIDTHNFDLELLNSLKEAAQTISSNFTESYKSKKNTGPTIWDLAEEVRMLFDGTNAIEGNRLRHTGSGRAEDFPVDADNEKRMIRVYTDLSIEILRKHKKPYDEFLLRKLITTAMTVHDSGKDIMRKKMYKNFCNLY